MSQLVLVAVADRWEGALVTALERSTAVTIARRCADLPDLLAAAASGLAPLALVSAELRGLDRTALEHLRASGVTVVGVHAPSDDDGERRLHQLGVETVVVADASGPEVEAALERAAVPDVIPAAPQAAGPGLTGTEPAGLDAAALAQIEDALAFVDDPPGEGSPHDGDGGRGIVLAVWGPAGAPGRTTLAVNLATELALSGSRVVLVDADTYGGCVAQALSLLDEAPGVSAATRSADHGTLDLPGLARIAPEVSPGLRVLTGVPKAERWPEVRAAALEHVLTLCRHLADVTVVDCGFSLEDDEELSYDTLAPRRNAATLTSLAAADVVVAVGAGDPVGLQRLVRGLQELAATASQDPVVVVNKVRAAAVGNRPEHRIRDALARFAGIDDPRFIPDDRDALDAAMLAGRALAEAAPSSAARQAIARLAAELGGRPEEPVAAGRRRRRRG